MTMQSLAFTPEAQTALDRYLARVNSALRAHPWVDADEVECEIRAHIEAELAGAEPSEAGVPVTASRLQEVIERLGSPNQWIPDEELPAWFRALVRFCFGPEDWQAACMTFGLFVAGLATACFAVHTYWTAAGAEMVVLVGLRTSLFAAVLLLASALLARATLTLVIAHCRPISARHWLVYPPLAVAYGVLAIAVFLLPPAPMLIAADPTFRSDMAAWFPEPFSLSFPLLAALSAGVWWAVLGVALVRFRSAARTVFWPFARWFDRRHGIRIACVGLVVALSAGIGLTVVVGC